MNYAFTAHGFQGTDMAVISGAWKSILMTQKTICDWGSDSAWNNKEYTLHSEWDKIFLWPQPHLGDTTVSSQTRSSSKRSHYAELPGETPVLKKKTMRAEISAARPALCLAFTQLPELCPHTSHCPKQHLPGRVRCGTLGASYHFTRTRGCRYGPRPL